MRIQKKKKKKERKLGVEFTPNETNLKMTLRMPVILKK